MGVINQRKSRGDTLIEVLFAVTIFSLIAVGGLSIMNQGTATAQRALEISLVRNEIDAQAEALRYMNASYIAAYNPGTADYTGVAAQWQAMSTHIKDHDHLISAYVAGPSCPVAHPASFILDSHAPQFIEVATIDPATTYSQVRYDGDGAFVNTEGVWIEAKSVETTGIQSNAGYIDFYINACWDSPGQSVPVRLGTIVRLYEPRP